MKQIVVVLMILLVTEVDARFINGTVYGEEGVGLPGAVITVKGTKEGATADINGFYSIDIGERASVTLVFSYVGYETKEVVVTKQKIVDVVLTASVDELQEVVVVDYSRKARKRAGDIAMGAAPSMMTSEVFHNPAYFEQDDHWNTEEYATIHENGFRKVLDKPLSTFSIDVDAASYSNVRRFINNGQLPPKDAVRIEEMINYFGYEYENPRGKDPFSINAELSSAPWNKDHLIAQIGLQGKKLDLDEMPASNIVFLIDVSGSMSSANKLPLLRSAFKLLVNELDEEDRVSIVVYAGAAGMVLPATAGDDKKKIMEALDQLNAGGSTTGGAGIKLAYKIAKENFIDGGNNRVILATDGDFNVGASSNAAMERLIEEKREDGVFLTVLGFGMGNYKDSRMEILADKGNGNYAYIDNLKEAKKVLVNEFGGTLFTIAKDVKIQVEFNPSVVQAYRLIGYENRKLNDEDFNDDKKDAGELGSGHTVTALYEIIPIGVASDFVKNIDELKYQQPGRTTASIDELLTVKFRYKEPEGEKSKLITKSVRNHSSDAGENLQWSMAVASFGMLLRQSEYRGDFGFDDILALAKSSKGKDEYGYRAEFIELVELAKGMSPRQ